MLGACRDILLTFFSSKWGRFQMDWDRHQWGRFCPSSEKSSIKCDAKGDVKANSNAKKEIEHSGLKKSRIFAVQCRITCVAVTRGSKKIFLIDRAKKGYARQLGMQHGALPLKPSACVLLEEKNDKIPEKVWPLAQQKSKSKFNDHRQKAYFTKKFEEEEKRCKKLKADEERHE